MKRHVLGLILGGALASGLLLTLFDVSVKQSASDSPPKPQFQNKCAETVFAAYLKSNLALSQQELLPSVPSIIAHRRRQEVFCLELTKCFMAEKPQDATPLAFATAFDSCLRDEALEEYGAKLED